MDPSFHNDHYPLCGSIITLSDFLIYCRRTKVIMAARGLWNLNVNMSMLLIFLRRTVLPWWCHQACFLSTAFRATGDITQLSAQVSRNWPSCAKLVQWRHVMHWSKNFILREDFKAASVWGRQTVVPLPSFSLPVSVFFFSWCHIQFHKRPGKQGKQHGDEWLLFIKSFTLFSVKLNTDWPINVMSWTKTDGKVFKRQRLSLKRVS